MQPYPRLCAAHVPSRSDESDRAHEPLLDRSKPFYDISVSKRCALLGPFSCALRACSDARDHNTTIFSSPKGEGFRPSPEETLSPQTVTDKILRDVRNRICPTRKEAEADFASDGSTVPFYRRASWRGAFWAALFIVAVRRTKMKVQKEAKERLRQISPRVVKFVEAKIWEILSVDVVNDNLPQRSQPHKRWVDALLSSALTYRDIGSTITVVDPNGTRHSATESFLCRATNILNRHIESEADGERVIHLRSQTLNEEIKSFPGKPELQRMTLYIRSPIGDRGFSLSISEQEKRTERLNARLVEEWKHQFAKFIPAGDEHVQDPRKKVMDAATALVEKLGSPPLDEDYEDSAQSALFA